MIAASDVAKDYGCLRLRLIPTRATARLHPSKNVRAKESLANATPQAV
jgi:hypothetical protein